MINLFLIYISIISFVVSSDDKINHFYDELSVEVQTLQGNVEDNLEVDTPPWMTAEDLGISDVEGDISSAGVDLSILRDKSALVMDDKVTGIKIYFVPGIFKFSIDGQGEEVELSGINASVLKIKQKIDSSNSLSFRFLSVKKRSTLSGVDEESEYQIFPVKIGYQKLFWWNKHKTQLILKFESVIPHNGNRSVSINAVFVHDNIMLMGDHSKEDNQESNNKKSRNIYLVSLKDDNVQYYAQRIEKKTDYINSDNKTSFDMNIIGTTIPLKDNIFLNLNVGQFTVGMDIDIPMGPHNASIEGNLTTTFVTVGLEKKF